MDQDVVPAEGQTTGRLELRVEDVGQRERALEEHAPRHQLVAAGA